MKIKTRRFIGDPLDPKRIMRLAAEGVAQYAHVIEDMYLDTVATWDSETGDKLAYPLLVEESARKYRVNIYVRGEIRRAYLLLEGGFMRVKPVVPGYSPKTRPGVVDSFTGGGIIGRGRLKTPKPVEAREFTRAIAEKIRSGDTELGTLRDHVARTLDRKIRVGPLVTTELGK